MLSLGMSKLLTYLLILISVLNPFTFVTVLYLLSIGFTWFILWIPYQVREWHLPLCHSRLFFCHSRESWNPHYLSSFKEHPLSSSKSFIEDPGQFFISIIKNRFSRSKIQKCTPWMTTGGYLSSESRNLFFFLFYLKRKTFWIPHQVRNDREGVRNNKNGFLIKCNISDRLFAKYYLYWTLTSKRLQALLGKNTK